MRKNVILVSNHREASIFKKRRFPVFLFIYFFKTKKKKKWVAECVPHNMAKVQNTPFLQAWGTWAITAKWQDHIRFHSCQPTTEIYSKYMIRKIRQISSCLSCFWRQKSLHGQILMFDHTLTKALFLHLLD